MVALDAQLESTKLVHAMAHYERKLNLQELNATSTALIRPLTEKDSSGTKRKFLLTPLFGSERSRVTNLGPRTISKVA